MSSPRVQTNEMYQGQLQHAYQRGTPQAKPLNDTTFKQYFWEGARILTKNATDDQIISYVKNQRAPANLQNEFDYYVNQLDTGTARRQFLKYSGA